MEDKKNKARMILMVPSVPLAMPYITLTSPYMLSDFFFLDGCLRISQLSRVDSGRVFIEVSSCIFFCFYFCTWRENISIMWRL